MVKFLALPTSQMLVLEKPGHATACLQRAARLGIEAATFKLPNGDGWGIVKLRSRATAKCPKCGYQRKTR